MAVPPPGAEQAYATRGDSVLSVKILGDLGRHIKTHNERAVVPGRIV